MTEDVTCTYISFGKNGLDHLPTYIHFERFFYKNNLVTLTHMLQASSEAVMETNVVSLKEEANSLCLHMYVC
jgi:hypothetical protein